ncbi:MAG: ATP-binding protein [Proteobacteria bacterium]|nr:ATP-binding protein [Pseudomonadota bacterium]
MPIPRLYDVLLTEHLQAHRQMVFVTGPRQVGKTTTCRRLDPRCKYLNWDDEDDRRLITRGPSAIVAALSLGQLSDRPALLVIDEIHKYRRWRTLLKGLFDKHADRLRIVVTGSSRMDVYRRGGDSLMGRYLLYRMHPLSVGELVHPGLLAREVRPPERLGPRRFKALYKHGGFPEPYAKDDSRFSRRWRSLRFAQLVREDVRDLSPIQDLAQLELAFALLRERSGCQLSYSSLARNVNVSVDTVRRWVAAACTLHYGFLVRPWFRNVAKSLRKEPKWFLRDWSAISDPGQRYETFVACHLLKSVQAWQDAGLGDYELRYLRDKDKREVDFLVVRDGEPWFMVEAKQSEARLSDHLAHFQRQTRARHAFQAVLSRNHVAASCFGRTDPCVVPASTLLSQLP